MKCWLWTVPLGILAVMMALGTSACGEEKGASTPSPQAMPTSQPPLATAIPAVRSGPKDIILVTTTSTQDTGLLDVLVPMFNQQTGYNVKVIAVGSGAALAMGERGDADVILAHAPTNEIALVDKGAAINRQLVMHNDFIIVGPASDPAGIKGMTSAAGAFEAIYQKDATFISRGDNSGTHQAEQALWKRAGLDPKGKSWYEQSGQGMGATLQIANQKGAYTLSDRGTYLAQRDRLDLRVLVEGDPVLFNVYHVMQVNPARFDKVNGPGGTAFVSFMVSGAVQEIIKEFGVDKYGQPLFIPDAGKDESQLIPN